MATGRGEGVGGKGMDFEKAEKLRTGCAAGLQLLVVIGRGGRRGRTERDVWIKEVAKSDKC